MNLPLNILKTVNAELTGNFIEASHKTFIVNLTWFQSTLINTFQVMMDEEVRSKQAFAREMLPPAMKEFVHASQLEKKFGGAAPTLTTYWPPRVPLMPEPVGIEGRAELVPRKHYIDYLKANPSLRPMPREMRLDLASLPSEKPGGSDLVDEFNSIAEVLSEGSISDEHDCTANRPHDSLSRVSCLQRLCD